MRQRYGKINHPELQVCFTLDELTYVCKEILPISTYTPKEDCEATLIHSSTTSLPKGLCEHRILTLEKTYWIPMHMSNGCILPLKRKYLLCYVEMKNLKLNYMVAANCIYRLDVKVIQLTVHCTQFPL
jgi:hypothetical protein